MNMYISSPRLFTSTLLSLGLCLAACSDEDGAGDSSSAGVSTTLGSETGDGTTDASSTGVSGTDSSSDGTGTTDTGTATTDTGTTGTTDTGTGTTDTGTTDTGTTGTTDTGGDGDCSTDPGWGPLSVGSPVKHITGTNHDGTAWDMGDWCGTKIAFDVSAVWCGPCQMMSACLAGDDSQCSMFFGGSYGADLRAAIEADSIKWVTFLTQNEGGGPSAVSDASAWDMSYHNAKIPVIAPDEHSQVEMYSPEFFPSLHALDEYMQFAAIDDGQTWAQLDYLLQ